MRIRLNGKDRLVEPKLTVRGLLDELGLPLDGIAVAIDRRVIPRSRHSTTELEAGAEIEVIRAVGGG